MLFILMQLNLNPKVSIDLTVATLVLISIIITILAPKTKRLFHFIFIQLGLLGIYLFYFFEAMAYLFLNEILAIISGIVLFPTAVSFLIGISYIMREKINTLSIVSICCFGVILCISAFAPNAITIELEDRFIMIHWNGWFKLSADIFQIVISGMIGYWGIITWFDAPFLIKREANLFLIGAMCIVLRVMINFLVYFNPIWILGVEMVVATGMILFTLSISYEPKILFILPFTLYRILIKDKDGYLLFNHDWSKSKINEQVFTGFLNAIQLMSNEVINLGGLLDVDLKEGILMFHESRYITAGLVSSKASKFLRNSLSHFIEDFEQMFEHDLKLKIKDPSRYESAYLLIDKYFANLPMRFIEDKKDAVLLESKFLEIPKQIEEKLRNTTKSQEELNSIKSELLKAPEGAIAEFFNLYDKLTREDDEDMKED
jgi:hypothetical protein